MATAKNLTSLPLDEIQGFILRGYNMAGVRHFVLRIERAAAARDFIGSLVHPASQEARITTAAPWTKKPDYCLNIGFTYQGLKQLQLPEFSFSDQYYSSFKEGAAARAEYIFDTGESAPEHWSGGLGTSDVHVLLSLYVLQADELESRSNALRSSFGRGGACTEISNFAGRAFPHGKIHFGYTDGISQPNIEGGARQIPGMQPVIPTYHFVLLEDAPSYEIPQPQKLGLYGSFVAFRVLEQDVVGFENFLNEHRHLIDPEKLAAKMCGRWRNGMPLVLSPEADEPVLSREHWNNYNYTETQTNPDDALGLRCPIGAHMRRLNPRGAKVAGMVDNHRIVRRGMPYGPPYDPQKPYDGIERGLLGMFICGSLENQFEFLMRVWANGDLFAADLSKGSKDPLLGNNSAGESRFDIPLKASAPPLKIEAFPRFIKARGGAYCFLPSKTALKYMARPEGM